MDLDAFQIDFDWFFRLHRHLLMDRGLKKKCFFSSVLSILRATFVFAGRDLARPLRLLLWVKCRGGWSRTATAATESASATAAHGLALA